MAVHRRQSILYAIEVAAAAVLVFSPPLFLVASFGAEHAPDYELLPLDGETSVVIERPWTPLPPPKLPQPPFPPLPLPPQPPLPPPEPPLELPALPKAGAPSSRSNHSTSEPLAANPSEPAPPEPNLEPVAEPTLEDLTALADAIAVDDTDLDIDVEPSRKKPPRKKPKIELPTHKCGDPMPEIQAMGGDNWRVDRNLAEMYATNLKLLQSLGWVRQHKGPDGKPDGWRFGGIECGNVLHQAGFRRGDVLQEVNGRPVRTVFQVFKTYLFERKKDLIVVKVVRRGEVRMFTFELIRGFTAELTETLPGGLPPAPPLDR